MNENDKNEYNGYDSELKTVTRLIGVFLLVLFILVYFATAAHGATNDCDSIRDPDKRHMCHAIAKHTKSECDLIRDHDTRVMCKTIVESGKR